MNKVTSVNLGGNAYQIEESGYDSLRTYLEDAARRLGPNPDKDEILADIERGIADKFRGSLGPYKNVITTDEVTRILSEMGPVQDDNEDAAGGAAGRTGPAGASGQGTHTASASASATADPGGPARRLYRIPDGAMIAGVCNGIAAFLAIDVMSLRIAFCAVTAVLAILSIAFPWLVLLPILAYVVLAFALPPATTAAERAAARGDPSTAQEYIRRAKAGYYKGIQSFQDSTSREHWKHLRREARKARRAGHYPPPVPLSGSMVISVSILGLLEAAIVLVSLGSICLLIARGSVAGVALPEGVPLWAGVVALAVLMQVAVWPIRVLRIGATGGAGLSGCGRSAFLDSIAWIAIAAVSLWVCDRYIPEVHEFLVALPEKMRVVVDTFEKVWHQFTG